MSTQFIFSSTNAAILLPTKQMEIPPTAPSENSTEISSPNRFSNKTEASEPSPSHRLDVKSEITHQNTYILHKQDSAEPQYSSQYSFRKVSSFGSLYRLSQVSLLSQRSLSANNISKSPNRQSIDQYIDVMSDADIGCFGKNISECIGLQRIISILVFYQNNYNNYDTIEQYLEVYNMNKHLINDYTHILDKHLNEDNMTAHRSNKQFSLIYQTMIDSHLYCDINECPIFQRNQRRRESEIIDDVFVDILDGIHCYFMHSIDIGYRIIDKSDHKHVHCTLNNNSDKCDADLVQLRAYLGTKVQKKRQISSRFSTNLQRMHTVFVFAKTVV